MRAGLVDDEDPSEDSGREQADSYVKELRLCLLSVALIFSVVLNGILVWVALVSDTGAGPGSPPTSLWATFDNDLRGAKYVDMTHAFSPTVPVWVGFGQPSARAAVAGSTMPDFISQGEEFTYAKHGFVGTSYSLTTDQLATQLDPPAHWNELGATISDIPATFSVRPLVVIDVHEKVQQDQGYQATREDCLAWEARHGMQIPEHSVVFFRSDWSKDWGYMTSDMMPAQFAGVGLGALKFLHLERGIMMHGHEPLDTDTTPNLEGEAWLMHNNFAQAEGVANLDKVAEVGCLVSIGFAKPLGGTGGYARLIAICPPSHPFGESIAEVPGAPLPTQKAPLRRNEDGVMRPSFRAVPTAYCEVNTSLGCVNGTPVWVERSGT